jgi:hypothetical protein
VAAAEQCMSICHRLNAAVEQLKKLVHRAAAFSCALSNRGNGSEYVLDAMVELTDQQALPFLGALAGP